MNAADLPAPTATPAGAPAPAEAPAPARRTRAEVEAEAQAGLQRLRDLEVVTVNGLVLKLPAAAARCYGPCWSEYEDVIVAEYERQLPRLRRLAEIGEGVRENSYPTVIPVERAAPALAALESLEIVDLGGLLAVAPRNNPRCYDLPCEEDIAAARTENESRSWFLERWAQLASTPRP